MVLVFLIVVNNTVHIYIFMLFSSVSGIARGSSGDLRSQNNKKIIGNYACQFILNTKICTYISEYLFRVSKQIQLPNNIWHGQGCVESLIILV